MKPDLSFLSDYARQWAEGVLQNYEVDEAQQPLVLLAAETLDSIAEAREQVNADGAFYLDGTGKPRKHPALDTMRNDKVVFARLCRELALSDSEDSRPPRLNYS
jgi:hypothetical protein